MRRRRRRRTRERGWRDENADPVRGGGHFPGDFLQGGPPGPHVLSGLPGAFRRDGSPGNAGCARCGPRDVRGREGAGSRGGAMVGRLPSVSGGEAVMAETTEAKVRFTLGMLVATPAAVEAFTVAGISA